MVWARGARFSKVPVTSGPDNLSGPLSGNFIGPDVPFLEAPVNFPGNFRPGKIGGRYQALTRASRSFAREGDRLRTTRSPFDFAADGKATGLSSWLLKDSAIRVTFNFEFFVVSKESNRERSLFCIII